MDEAKQEQSARTIPTWSVLNVFVLTGGLSARVILADRVMRLSEEEIDVAVRIAPLSDTALRATRFDSATTLGC